jgi:hypothetical protein
MQDDDSLLRSFVTTKPAAEKILSDGTDVDGTAKYRRARTESLEYLSQPYFSKFNSNTLLIVQYFKFELCSYQFNPFVWLTLLNLQASVLPGE